jgi:acetyl esterase/lipase
MKSRLLMAGLLSLLATAAFGQAQPQPGPRHLPARTIPVPDTVSPQVRALIAAPVNPIWNVVPKTAAEWKAQAAKNAAESLPGIAAMRDALRVKTQAQTIAGVKTYIVTPAQIAPANRNRVLLYFHGGGFVLRPGEAGLAEAIEMAGFGRYKVISVDYRLTPDFPYPAALDDAMAVYRDTLKTVAAKNIGIFGTSAGGNLALAMVLRARAEKLPQPGAIAPGTPWSDLTKTGDSYFTNDGINNVLVSNDGFWGAAAKLYAGGRDLKDPMISPVYGDLHGFPPTLLTSGTRDLFLSNTVRVHRKLRQAGVEAELQVFERQSHAQYYRDIKAPETVDYNNEVARFFDRHLGVSRE